MKTKLTKQAFKWGFYDTKGHFWYGDDDGPKIVDTYDLARVVATIMNQMFRCNSIRPRVIPPEVMFNGGTVTAKLTAEEALKRMGA